MAIVNAANTGNWSNSAIWPGGTFPTASDDVYANGKTVTIDQNVTVLSLNTTSAGGGVAGGGFTIGANCILTAVINAGTTNALTLNANYTVTHIGGKNGSLTTASAVAVSMSNGVLHSTGAAAGGSQNFTYAYSLSATIALTQIGAVNGGIGNSASGINASIAAGATILCSGAITGGSNANANGLRVLGGTSSITGDVTGGSVAAGIMTTGILEALTITGVAVGGSGASVPGVQIGHTGTVSIDTARGGTAVGAVGINNTIDSLTVTVKNLDFQTLKCQSPTLGAIRFVPTIDYNILVNTATGTARYLPEPVQIGFPAVTDVRHGTSFAGGTYTGTAYIPGASSVAAGVPVDHTVGTAVLLETAQVFQDILTALGSISVDLTPVLTDAALILADTNAILADTVILTGGAGSRAVTIQLYETSTTTPIVGVNVAAYNAGGDLMAQGTSTAAGQVLFALADGAHGIRMSKAGVVFDIETITVSGDGSFTLYGLPATIPAPAVPNYCVVYETITNTTTRTAPATITATAKLTELPYDYNGQLFTGEIITGTYAAGIVSWQFPWGSQAVVSIDETNTLKEITVPSTANARISTL